MSWWGWVLAGAILFGAELAGVSAQFYLVFIGGAALLIGALTAALPALAIWAQWALFALLACASMIGFRRRVYRRLHGRMPALRVGPVGRTLTLPVPLAPGESCQVEYGGSFWTARNEGDRPIAPGARARIDAVRGLTLIVHTEL